MPLEMSVESGSDAPLARPLPIDGGEVGNRLAILPMEGWDGTEEGAPTSSTVRRWRRFGSSGAKLIWGGEAVAVRRDGRASPRQLMIDERTLGGIEGLRKSLEDAHVESFGTTDGLLVGLQLTHSGRFSRPDTRGAAPLTLYRHPILDEKAPSGARLLTDSDIDRLIVDFVNAAVLAQRAGFEFVDVKHCHGYLGHEFLSSVDRPGRYGGSFENRTRFLRGVVDGIRAEAPGLQIGVRISAIDWVPFRTGSDGIGEAWTLPAEGYRYAFGGDGSGVGIDLAEPVRLLELLSSLGIRLVCITVGSPYYSPHIQRPALFPPSDGYQPPEDPLRGVARQIDVVAKLKERVPEMIYVGSGYSYLQEWLPNVAQAAVRRDLVDSVGLGRMALAYPEMPADVLAGRPLQTKRLCRTFSDCTTAPRNGMISGCYPLDKYYKERPEFARLQSLKSRPRQPRPER